MKKRKEGGKEKEREEGRERGRKSIYIQFSC
jgi:hypothetical protein